MGYRTVDELEHFNFSDAEIYSITQYRNQLIYQLGYVTILGNNSCNRDIREMGTNELTLKLQNVTNLRIVLEGYKLYDADGNLKESCEDEEIPETRYNEIFKELENSTIYALEQREREYCFFVDTEERTYTMVVEAEHNVQEWERFMNKTPSY